jgi:hypothetical protein
VLKAQGIKETGNEEVSTAATKQNRNFSQQKLTIGLDLGDRSSYYCVLDETGQIVMEQILQYLLSSLEFCACNFSKPIRDAAMMRTRTTSAAAEAVAAVPTLSSCSLWLIRAIFRSRNSLALFIHVSAVAATSGLRLWFRGCVGSARIRLL